MGGTNGKFISPGKSARICTLESVLSRIRDIFSLIAQLFYRFSHAIYGLGLMFRAILALPVCVCVCVAAWPQNRSHTHTQARITRKVRGVVKMCECLQFEYKKQTKKINYSIKYVINQISIRIESSHSPHPLSHRKQQIGAHHRSSYQKPYWHSKKKRKTLRIRPWYKTKDQNSINHPPTPNTATKYHNRDHARINWLKDTVCFLSACDPQVTNACSLMRRHRPKSSKHRYLPADGPCRRALVKLTKTC